MNFVDTNYFLRYLLQDISNQYTIAKRLFTSSIVIFELYWVLTKYYKKSEKEVLNAIKQMVESSNLGLQDSFNLVYSLEKNTQDFITFDSKLHKAFLASK